MKPYEAQKWTFWTVFGEIQGQKVMLDRELAELYGVEIKRLNESVKRNIKRFPPEFMFQLTDDEWSDLRPQIATLNLTAENISPTHLPNMEF